MGKKGRSKRPDTSSAASQESGSQKTASMVNPDVPKLIFSNFMEFLIVLFCVFYSLFCLDAYLLDALHLKLSVINLSATLGTELLLLWYITGKKIVLNNDTPPVVYGFFVFLISCGISLMISPTLLPINWSADYPNHYILVDYLSVHEQLPLLSSGLGEMVQYPFGPSLLTSVTAKVLSLPLMISLGLWATVIIAIMAVTVYLLSRELLMRLSEKKSVADMAGLVSVFMIYSVPAYFLDQYCGNFYYSMIFGELLVLLSLLALMKMEKGDALWFFIFLPACMGIIFSYTLFIIIPFAVLVIVAFLNPDKFRFLMDRNTIIAALLVISLFGFFSYERMAVGTHILRYEGLTVELSILNFNIIFIALVLTGIVLCVKTVPGYLRSALFVSYAVLIAEYFGFAVLDRFGLIALYYANKIFYLFILLMSVSACIPVFIALQYIRKDQFRAIAAIGIIGLVGIFSLFMVQTFPLHDIPVVTNEDAIFAQKAETYLHAHDIPYDNLSITTERLKGYWLGLLLHMDKEYAQRRFLDNVTPFSDWLKNPNARYVIGEMVNASYPEYFEMDGIRLQIVVREGQKVLIRKVD